MQFVSISHSDAGERLGCFDGARKTEDLGAETCAFRGAPANRSIQRVLILGTSLYVVYEIDTKSSD